MRSALFVLVSAALAGVGSGPAAAAQSLDPEFKPELVGAELSSREVRPGDPFTLALRFRNAGTKPARGDYQVFVHLEAPTPDCRNLIVNADHPPVQATSTWEPGVETVDGPMVLSVPADKPEQEYAVHVGLYDMLGTGQRLLDTYAAGKLRVSRQAPGSRNLKPPPLAADELRRRQEAVAARLSRAERVTLEADVWRFDLDRASGAWQLLDKASGALWTSDLLSTRFGEVMLVNGERRLTWAIRRFDEVNATPDVIRLVVRPQVDGQATGTAVIIAVERVSTPAGIRFRYETRKEGGWTVKRVRLLDQALATTEAEAGRLYVPHRLGLELQAGAGLPARQSWRLYDGLSMGMCGAVKDGSALLVNWETIDSDLSTQGRWLDDPRVPGGSLQTVTLDLQATEGGCSLHPLGRGGYVEIARAYRPLAEAKGWRRTWARKRGEYPGVDRFFGAMDFKPFVLSRVLPSSRFCPDGKERVYLGFTFDEVAQCAEHWRRDLEIDRAFVVLAGWIKGGYDVHHPDVLPAAPECGGDAGLQDAARRIKACGYLFGLHDNYQDMYETAPSYDVKWLNTDAAGKPRMGGNWNGGQAWQVCAIKQVELAERPQTNLPRIAELFGPNVYFIDTVFAWPLVTCEAPAHPMGRADDLLWKSRLCLAAKKHFGLFGSEEGREWSVACADYLEGIFGHCLHAAPGEVIPLFPLVYSDCVQLMGHQGDRMGPGDEKKILDHVLFAEMILPDFGQHLYWQKQGAGQVLPLTPLAPRVKDLGNRRFEITFRWRVDATPTVDGIFFVHFTHPASTRGESIAYQADHAPAVPTSRWQPGSVVEDGPHVVTVPPEFDGRSEIRIGALVQGERRPLGRSAHEGLRYGLGWLDVSPAGITFTPPEPGECQDLWAQGEGGWGEKLSGTDRVIKNTWEVLSPLNLITAERPLDSHEFLNPERTLQRTRFGDLTIIVSYGRPAAIGDHRVPAYGFIVDSPAFVAVCVTRYNGVDYPGPVLFTARSLDGQPLATAAKVRIYHGFGSPRLRLAGRDLEVPRESVVSLR